MRHLQRRFLLHSRWTALVPIAGQRHFEVVAVDRQRVTLRAVLTRGDHQREIVELADVTTWAPGWRSLLTT